VSDVPRLEQWASPGWRAEVAAWVDEHLPSRGLTRTGDLEEVQLRPWGVVLRASTTGGTVFMKAGAPTTSFEAGLYELLVRVAPDHVVHPIALDVDAGWLLLPDGGPVLGEQLGDEVLLDRLLVVLPQYAQLQVDLADHVEDLLALGVADMRPARMLARFDEAVAGAQGYADVHGSPEQRAALERVVGLRATFGRWCARLDAAVGAPSLDHNDLHGGNVFATGLAEGGTARFVDWGDAVVAHPFASALVVRSVVRWTLDVHAETPQERRLLDAYLEPFTDLATRAELGDAVEVACEVGKIARSLVWARAVALLPPGADDPEGFADAPLRWVLELLDGPMAASSPADRR
jgi:hypothetical protein